MSKSLSYKQKPPVVNAFQYTGQPIVWIIGEFYEQKFAVHDISVTELTRDLWIELTNHELVHVPFGSFIAFERQGLAVYTVEAFYTLYEVN